MSSSPLRGQELFRQALDGNSLQPFCDAMDTARQSQDASHQADALKAVRFGLAGLALHGWESTITKPLPSHRILPFGGSVLEHEFRKGVVPPHDSSVVDERPNLTDVPYVRLTQGQAALKNMNEGLQLSAARYLTPPWWARRRHVADSQIQVRHVLGGISAAVALEQDLAPNIPDFYVNGEPQYQGFYMGGIDGQTGEIIIPSPVKPLASAAANPIRFSTLQIVASMEQLAQIDLGEQTAMHAEHVLLAIFKHITRASQRQDGVGMVPNADSLLPGSRNITLIPGADGMYESTWEGKECYPAQHLAPGQSPPKDGVALGTARNKCPIGYKPNAYTPMPIARITSAILYYLKQHNLHLPEVFTGPKQIITSPYVD
ncbi:MAG: hypothetical protein ABWY71_00235 [Candidatus Saccharimonadales bacterium]